ncbi:DUF1552 domain-containing protein [Tautonia rosea]|uniref:DUF1552 domain-containing protein n=1 Tax=Tautonia rosea TaxID=2728037 RepID=UPI0014741567|nr:DUF1552 domain-containing protein [Tautonia rosea]
MNFALSRPVSRRTLLRGLGVAVALPWLEAMAPRRTRAAVPQAHPARFAFLYTPNGYSQPTFVPKGTGTGWELTSALEPLAPVRAHVTLVTGLDRAFVPGTGVHAQCGSCWLTSSPPAETLDGGFPTNTTLDQFLARSIGRDTPLPSLELSCNDFADNKETKYFECISWYGPGYAANVEKDPRAVFDRLFGQGPGDPSRGSILDAIRDDAESLGRRLGLDDRRKLDEYLSSVRATERRIQLAERSDRRDGPPPLDRPSGIPDHRGEYLRLMGDLIVFAFQQDRTRVATLVVDPERWDSPRMFHDVFDTPQNHHVLTHTKGEEAKAKLAQIDRFHVDQFASIVSRLGRIVEGEGTLLDSCVLAMGSGISDGDSHNYRDLQVLLAGRAGGALTPGRHLHYEGDRPLADLWLTLAQLGGVDVPRFADSTGVLDELLT